MHTEQLIEKIQIGEMDSALLDIYVDETKLEYQKKRYVDTIRKFEKYYEKGEVKVFSAPGRSEIGGNHTDHQRGKVLAASINLDTLGMVRATDDNMISIISDD